MNLPLEFIPATGDGRFGAAAIAEDLRAVRERAPLVHNVTNFVAMNVSANALLAVGASPVMAHAAGEVGEMAALASAVVLNIGTLDEAWIEAMLRAGQAANRKGIPLVLDPVGAGATGLRNEACRRLLGELRFSLIRGNASEVASLLGESGQTRGVDSSLAGLGALEERVCRFATERQAIVAVTGPSDFVTDGRRRWRIDNGHILLTRITASGCSLSSLCGAFLAVEKDPLLAAAAALAYFSLCGERAAEKAQGPGSFQVALLDALAATMDSEWTSGLRLSVGG